MAQNAPQLPTQVGRALEELGIEIIVARSPEAKGRIERLWLTFQDRLVSELRLAKAATLERANAVLARFREEYNCQFAQAPQQAGSAYRKLDRRLDLDRIFSLQRSKTCLRRRDSFPEQLGGDIIAEPLHGIVQSLLHTLIET